MTLFEQNELTLNKKFWAFLNKIDFFYLGASAIHADSRKLKNYTTHSDIMYKFMNRQLYKLT